MYSLEPRIKIVGGIANIADAVGARLSRGELAAILNLFGQRTASGCEYTDTSVLIKKALDLFAEIDEPTAENITTAFTNAPSAAAASAEEASPFCRACENARLRESMPGGA